MRTTSLPDRGNRRPERVLIVKQTRKGIVAGQTAHLQPHQARGMACADSTESSAPQPYLQGGSGWRRRVSAAQEGRRYVPRGGHVMDFSKPPPAHRPHSRREAAASARQVVAGACAATPPSAPLAAGAAGQQHPRWSPPWALDQEGPAGSAPRASMASDPHHWERYGRAAATSERPACQAPGKTMPPKRAAASTPPRWRPPGAALPPTARRTAAASLRSAAPTTPDCSACACCADARQLLHHERQAAWDEREAATQARRKLEAALSRAERDRADLEQLKASLKF